MLRGRFGDTTGRPYLEGRLLIPRLGIDANISFLVDTGADTSLLSPSDAFEMGVDYSLLTGETESLGTAGIAHNFTEPASIAFTEPGGTSTSTTWVWRSRLRARRSSRCRRCLAAKSSTGGEWSTTREGDS